ncbi:hypothetical protein KAW80_02975 [Candidatus Babeliales bacterium]|nr:hypothetical protein [Candidatus Babeliales bacterium]
MLGIIKKEKKFLFLLFFVSFVIRAAVFHFYLSKNQRFWQIDSDMYHQLAVSLSKGKGVVLEGGQPNFYRLPGYSLFLVPFYNVFGVKYLNNVGPDQKGVFIALWGQLCIAALIPLLIFFLSLTLFPSILLAKIASLWSVFHLGFVLYSGFFMTESLFILFFLLFAILFLSNIHLFFCPVKYALNKLKKISIKGRKGNFFNIYIRGFCMEPGCESQDFLNLFEEDIKVRGGYSLSLSEVPSPGLFAAGLFLGIAGMIRPVGHYFLILSLLIILFSHGELRSKLKRGLTLFGGFIFPVLPWLIRNYVLLGYIFFHTLSGIHFLYLSAARVAMHTHNCSYWDAREILNKEAQKSIFNKEKALGRKLNEIEVCKEREKIAVKCFKQKPFIAFKNWATDILRTSLSLYSAELLYLDSGREEYDYFRKGRSVWSMFERYLFPQTTKWYLKIIVYLEILMFLFIILGFVFGIGKVIYNLFFYKRASDYFIFCNWKRSILFIVLFIVVSLAGGYARMRLPAEAFLIILSLSFWISVLSKQRLYSVKNS